jgi:UDP-4-amino-4,6-dideoxy-N-acetyl-beta-L-altrosamine transaminase
MHPKTYIPYGRQSISEEDIEAVVKVLRSEFLTQGPVVPEFEALIAKYCQTKHGIAVNSATSALHIACLALDLGPGDWLWTSPITFVASANCGLYCGARVDFVDIDPKTYNMCPLKLEEKLIEAKKNGNLPKVVVAVHFSGQPCDLHSIYLLSQKYGFRVIEDASHAIGAKYKGEPVGNCRYSDISVFSFHPVKIITTAEGGMALTNQDVLAEKMALLRSHGITRDASRMTRTPDGPWYYQQIDLGFNYRMTELQAALGISQMDHLDEFVARRHEIANRYEQALNDFPVTKPWQHPDIYSGMHLYVIRLQLNSIKKTHSQVFKVLREQGIGVNLHYVPIHTQPFFQKMGFCMGDYPKAEHYYSEAISLPIFQGLSHQQQDQVINELGKALIV